MALNVYSVPLARPVMLHLPAAPVTVQVLLLSCTAATVYEVGTLPGPEPLATVIVACASPPTAVGVAGTDGATAMAS